MATIKDLPDHVIDAGSAYDWSSWDQNTRVTLTSVSWDNTYKDIVEFGSSYSKFKTIDEYIDSKDSNVTYNNLAYQDINKPVRIPLAIGYAQYFNYIRVTTRAQPDTQSDIPRTFYYFITDVRRVAPDTTEIIVQLDVWNTYRKYVNFGNCFVTRGHILMADKNRTHDHGRALLNTPEGLDAGSEYVGRLGSAQYVLAENDDYKVMIVSTISWLKDFGTKDNPKLNMATGTMSQHMFNGVDIYVMDLVTWQAFVPALSVYPWITQGIVSIQAVPGKLLDMTKLKKINMPNIKIANASAYTLNLPPSGAISSDVNITLQKDWRTILKNSLPQNFRKFDKLFTYPYTQVTLTGFNGAPVVLKPECWNSDDMVVRQLTQVTPPNSRVVWTPINYNVTLNTTANADDQAKYGDWLGTQTGIYNWPTYMMSNDGARLAYASQAHSISWAYSSADWSQQKALNAASTASAQATNSIANMGQQNNVAVNARNQQTANSNWNRSQQNRISNASALGGASLNGLSSIATRGAAGAVGAIAGLAGAGLTMMAGNASTAASNSADIQSANIANAASSASTAISQSGAAYVRDTNKQYADYAANGDYANAVAGINAKVQDLAVVPPSTAGQMGGETFNTAVWKWSLVAQVRTISDGSMRIICDYWARYGYAINRYFRNINSTLNIMKHFTYWQVSELYLGSSKWCPQNYLNTMRGIFEKGVTVWNDPDEIGMVDIYSNDPTREGVYF